MCDTGDEDFSVGLLTLQTFDHAVDGIDHVRDLIREHVFQRRILSKFRHIHSNGQISLRHRGRGIRQRTQRADQGSGHQGEE